MKTLPNPTPPVTVAEALAELLEVTAQRVRDGVRSKATLEMQTAHRRYWILVLGEGRPANDVDEYFLEELASRPRPRGSWGPATLRKRLSTLKGALELVHRRRRLERVPAFPVVLAPWRPRQRFLSTFEDARRLFDALNERLPHRAVWFWVALWTCMHASDVEALLWSDLDLRAETIWLKNTKNRKPALRVRCPMPLLEVLRVLHQRERPKPTDPIVKPWASRKTTLPAYCRRLGLPELNAIDLRHTGLSWAARRKGITPALCKFAGHSSPAMMARTYAHALPPELEEVTAELESMAKEPRR